MTYPFRYIEKKWQKFWKKTKKFQSKNKSFKPKFYVLDMFPYPSGSGLHVGHLVGYISSDIYARYKRTIGYNVLHPIGFDSFGLPAEQYAIQTGKHPAITTNENIFKYKKQLARLGFSFDWGREICTSDPSYYRWTQWIFIQLFNSWYDISLQKARSIKELINIFEKNGNLIIKASCEKTNKFNAYTWNNIFSFEERENILKKYRLAFLSETVVNFCPVLGTILANDEIKNGKSERGCYPVYKKKTIQWNIRISAYAERLLKGLYLIDWKESIKELQRNWIGKSLGVNINFNIFNKKNLKIEIFTTRPDTIFGVSFIVLAPEHWILKKIITFKQINYVKEYFQEKNEITSENNEIYGIFTDKYVLHPFTYEKLPIYISNYIIQNYGTGAIMAVPAQNKKDNFFATKFCINIKNEVIDKKKGICINSYFLNGLIVKDAIKKAIKIIEKKGIGSSKINYKLKDTVFSRQRYWGEPIPIYYKKGIACCIPEQKLPLILPTVDKFIPTEDCISPLGRAKYWAWNEKKQEIVSNDLIDNKNIFPLETSTMPGLAGSSWYFLRFMDTKNKNFFLKAEYEFFWKNVDLYIGGSEHATGHLLYARFLHKFLKDKGWISTEEPFTKLLNQGMILGKSALLAILEGTKYFISSGLINKNQKVQKLYIDINLIKENNSLDIEGFKNCIPYFNEYKFFTENGSFFCQRQIEKMSKSKYNIINPDDICNKYGADVLRMYEMFLGPIYQTKLWNTKGINGVHQFLQKLWKLFHTKNGAFYVENINPSGEALKILHSTIKKVQEDIINFSFNTAISSFMIAINKLKLINCKSISILEPLIILIAPFAPHLAEEIWELLKNKISISFVPMPKYDEKYIIDDIIEYPIHFNGKLRFKMKFQISLNKEKILNQVLENEQIQNLLKNKKQQQIIFIPKKIINIISK